MMTEGSMSVNDRRKAQAPETVRRILQTEKLWDKLEAAQRAGLIALFRQQVDHCLEGAEEAAAILDAARSILAIRTMPPSAEQQL